MIGRRVSINHEEIELLDRVVLHKSYNGRPMLDTIPNQWNLEFYFEGTQEGFGFQKGITRNQTAKALMELAMKIMEK